MCSPADHVICPYHRAVRFFTSVKQLEDESVFIRPRGERDTSIDHAKAISGHHEWLIDRSIIYEGRPDNVVL